MSKIQLDKSLWRVEPTNHRTAMQLTQQWHYTRTGSNTAVYAFGLFLQGGFRPFGISWWIPPVYGSVEKYNPGGFKSSLMLHRLVVVPGMATNAASFLLGRSIRLIKQDAKYDFLITYASMWRGHEGIIYKATNWDYRGVTEPTGVWLTEDGRMLGQKYGGGGSYTHEQMNQRGASLHGYFSRHCYTMRLKVQKRIEPIQLSFGFMREAS